MRKCNRCGNCHIGYLILAPKGVMILIVAEVESALSFQEDIVYEDSVMGIHERTPLPAVRDFREFVFA
jgi:hypothetical protein